MSQDQSQRDPYRRLSLQAIGVTLISVVVSTGVTVGFGLSGPIWVRATAGIGTSVALLLTIKLTSRADGSGPLARVANWLTGVQPEQTSDDTGQDQPRHR